MERLNIVLTRELDSPFLYHSGGRIFDDSVVSQTLVTTKYVK